MEVKITTVIEQSEICPPDPLRPEKNLATAILERAIKDAAREFDINPGNPRWCVHSASEWLASDDLEYPLSFVNVCELLGFHPIAMRRAIYRLINETPDDMRCLPHRKTFSYTRPRAREKTLKVA